MKQKIILYLYLCLLSIPTFAGWQRMVTNYSRHTYKAASQNWMVMQNMNGWMYFANNKGLLEFDGNNWDVYPIHNAKMRAVKCGYDGRIYVGGLLQFGYFIPNTLGKLDYICLSDSIMKDPVGNIWDIHVSEKRVYFESDHAIFYLEDERLHRVECPSITSSALIKGSLYVAANGLYRLEGKMLVKLPETDNIVNNITHRVVNMHSYNDMLMVVYDRQGIRLYKDNKWLEFDPELQECLRNEQIFCSTKNNNLLAIGTVQNGIYLFNLQEKTVEHISVHNGLQNKTILSLSFDQEKNLWVGLDNGIDCIHLNSPLLQNSMAIGSGYTSCVFKNKLYLGTNQGVFQSSLPIDSNQKGNIQPVSGISGQIYSLLQYVNYRVFSPIF